MGLLVGLKVGFKDNFEGETDILLGVSVGLHVGYTPVAGTSVIDFVGRTVGAHTVGFVVEDETNVGALVVAVDGFLVGNVGF